MSSCMSPPLFYVWVGSTHAVKIVIFNPHLLTCYVRMLTRQTLSIVLSHLVNRIVDTARLLHSIFADLLITLICSDIFLSIFLIHAFVTKKCVLQQQGNFSNSSAETSSGAKLTFQDRLLLLFVILPDHMTIPRKGWFPVLQAFVVYFAPITWFKRRKKKNFGPRVTTCLFHYQRKAGSP